MSGKQERGKKTSLCPEHCRPSLAWGQDTAWGEGRETEREREREGEKGRGGRRREKQREGERERWREGNESLVNHQVLS